MLDVEYEFKGTWNFSLAASLSSSLPFGLNLTKDIDDGEVL